MLAVLCTQATLVPLTISLPSSSPLATAPAHAALPSHHTLSRSTQSVSNLGMYLGVFPSSETTLPVPSSLLASEEKTLSEEDLEKREAARRVAWVVFIAGGAPSVFAQYSLVWSKEPKKKAEAKAEAARLAAKQRRPAERGGLPKEVQAVVDARFRAAYAPQEVDALWKVLRAAYGSEARALQAVQQNPTILNPAYTSPPGLVSRSKAALVEVLGEEGALEVMLQNPAVLQCGEALREQPAGQIRSFASFRRAVDALPAATPLVLLGTLGLLVGFVISGRNGALPAEADGLVQGAGVLLAGAGILATFGSLVLQNVAETGNPGKKK